MSETPTSANAPSVFLKTIVGQPVSVKLNNGSEYRGWLTLLDLLPFLIVLLGILASLDGYLNLCMEETEEYERGVVKTRFGDVFLRGNNGLLVVLCICLRYYIFIRILFEYGA